MRKNFRKITYKSSKRDIKRPSRLGPERLAGYMLLIGQPLLLASLCALAATLHAAVCRGDIGIRLEFLPMGEYIAVSVVILYGSALLLNYLEKFYSDNKNK